MEILIERHRDKRHSNRRTVTVGWRKSMSGVVTLIKTDSRILWECAFCWLTPLWCKETPFLRLKFIEIFFAHFVIRDNVTLAYTLKYVYFSRFRHMERFTCFPLEVVLSPSRIQSCVDEKVLRLEFFILPYYSSSIENISISSFLVRENTCTRTPTNMYFS